MPKCRKPAAPRRRAAKEPLPPPGRWEIVVPDWIPVSVNTLVGRMGQGTGRKAKDRKTLSLFVGHVRPADRPRRLHVEYSYPKGRVGIDLSNGFKSIEDALVKLGVLKNDSRKWLNWVSATSVEGPLGTRIVVADEGYEGEG